MCKHSGDTQQSGEENHTVWKSWVSFTYLPKGYNGKVRHFCAALACKFTIYNFTIGAKESKPLDTTSRWLVLQQVDVLRHSLLSHLASLSCAMPVTKIFLVFY